MDFCNADTVGGHGKHILGVGGKISCVDHSTVAGVKSSGASESR